MQFLNFLLFSHSNVLLEGEMKRLRTAIDVTSAYTLTTLNYFVQTMEPKGFFDLKSEMSYLTLSDLFEYLCDGSTAI